MTNFRIKSPRKISSWSYSFIVSLPQSWLRHHGIGKGDLIDFEVDSDMNLILKPILKLREGENAKTK